MADQNAAPTEEQQIADSSTTEIGTQQEQATPSVNWEERAKEHQSWGTRLAQENAELKTKAQLVADLESDDPATYNAALRKLGFNVPEEQEEEAQQEGELDPRIAAKLAKLDELEQRFNSRDETAQQQEHYAQYREQFDPKLKDMGVPDAFLTNVADIAYNQLDAIQTPQGPQPDLEGAFAQFLEVAEMFAEVPQVQKKVRKNWANTKPQSAFTSAGGGEGTQVLDTSNHENRVAYAMSRLNNDQQ